MNEVNIGPGNQSVHVYRCPTQYYMGLEVAVRINGSIYVIVDWTPDRDSLTPVWFRSAMISGVYIPWDKLTSKEQALAVQRKLVIELLVVRLGGFLVGKFLVTTQFYAYRREDDSWTKVGELFWKEGYDIDSIHALPNLEQTAIYRVRLLGNIWKSDDAG